MNRYDPSAEMLGDFFYLRNMKCKWCSKEDAKFDVFCSFDCYDQYRDLNFKAVEKSREPIKTFGFAQKGDTIEYEGKDFTVYATDCTNERILNKRHKTYNYVAVHGDEKVEITDLKQPLYTKKG